MTVSLDQFVFLLFLCRYIFPGLALGAALGQTGVVTNAMINKAAEVRLDGGQARLTSGLMSSRIAGIGRVN